MQTPDGRFHLAYNGELYNDEDLRSELIREGAVPGGFRSQCDTETVLYAFAHWGPDCFARLRGMFAIAIYDSQEHALYLARDPHGLKPLYIHHGSQELTFASEIRAILAHPGIEARPNMPMVSAYLSTVRSVLGRHTLFRGIQSILPGEYRRYDAMSGRLQARNYYHAAAVQVADWDEDEATETVRQVFEDSVKRHITSDVPVCAFLSGGLDSSIICRLLSEIPDSTLSTWCSGGANQATEQDDDLGHARRMATRLGARHTEVHIDQARFNEDWPWMVGELGVPLSTPNEVAIHAVAKDMRAEGFVVALSGEGADELFAGYDFALDAAARFCASKDDMRSGGQFQFESAVWMPDNVKEHLFGATAWSTMEQDGLVRNHYDEMFERSHEEAGPDADPIEAHLRFLRHSNLTGLLQRFDTSTMLASIEGRTPFADTAVLDIAERLPVGFKRIDPHANQHELAPAGAMRSKRVLRSAWQDRLPREVRERPKQSFPLPFETWMRDNASVLVTSRFMRESFDRDLCEQISIRPEQYFQFAWPLINIGLWADNWW
ncbi:MAG: asparagine synthase (glutamine-hydrolyzing) [Planctomycetota bacterium]|jgi:asparagine synthase (glutamine-hydrolysing)